jgi:hypothetical protein
MGMMPSEIQESPGLPLLIGGGFLLIGLLFLSATALFLMVDAQIVLIPFFGVGVAAAALGWVILTRAPYAAVLSGEGLALKFVLAGDAFITWGRIRERRNLFLGRAELLHVHNPDPGRLQVVPVTVLIHYRSGATNRFAVLTLPGIGPLLGRDRQYKTAREEFRPTGQESLGSATIRNSSPTNRTEE